MFHIWCKGVQEPLKSLACILCKEDGARELAQVLNRQGTGAETGNQGADRHKQEAARAGPFRSGFWNYSMESTMLLANSEHFTSSASGIWRARS